MKKRAKKLNHDGGTKRWKKPAEYPEPKHANATTEEWHRGCEEHEKECDEQNCGGRLPELYPNS